MNSAGRPPEEPASKDLWRDLLFVTFKWLPEMALIFVLGIGTGFGYLTLFRGQLYETTAKLYVRIGIDQTPSPSLSTDRSITYLSQTRGAVQSEIDLLRNAALIEQLIRENNLASEQKAGDPANLLQWIKRTAKEAVAAVKNVVDQALAAVDLKVLLTRTESLRQQISQSILIDTSLNSDIISITLRWPDKTTAAPVLDRFIELYLRFRSTLFESDQEVLFLERQRDDALQSIDAIEAEKAKFERSHDARNLANRAQLLEADVIEAENAFEKAKLELQLTEQRLSRLRNWNAEQSDTYGLGTIPSDSPSASIANSIASLLGELGRLRASNSQDARQVKEIEAKLMAVRSVLEQQFQAEIQDRLRTNEQARKRFERVSASLRDIQEVSTSLRALDRRREIAEFALSGCRETACRGT